MNLSNPIFHEEDKAREHFEALRWPNGPYCPHCGNADPERVSKLDGTSHRPGLYLCNECREQFTVTVGSVMERSHIPLAKWALGFFLMASSKKGVSAHQLMRQLGHGSYRTAWFMAHRIREAMKEDAGDTGPLGGEGKVIEADETYYGKAETPRKRSPRSAPGKTGKRHPSTKKCIIVSLVERGGRARSFHVEAATGHDIRAIMVANVSRKSDLNTDEAGIYKELGEEFARHEAVNHSKDEYARYVNERLITTNSVEGFFSTFKRGMKGIYQHCGEAHLHRYLAEFDFRYNRRAKLGISDAVRAEDAIKGAAGKRLTYRQAGEGHHA